jgi:hypothetical protein
MSDWKRDVKVAEEIKKSTERIDILINDAARGIMTYALTDYGLIDIWQETISDM